MVHKNMEVYASSCSSFGLDPREQDGTERLEQGGTVARRSAMEQRGSERNGTRWNRAEKRETGRDRTGQGGAEPNGKERVRDGPKQGEIEVE